MRGSTTVLSPGWKQAVVYLVEQWCTLHTLILQKLNRLSAAACQNGLNAESTLNFENFLEAQCLQTRILGKGYAIVSLPIHHHTTPHYKTLASPCMQYRPIGHNNKKLSYRKDSAPFKVTGGHPLLCQSTRHAYITSY